MCVEDHNYNFAHCVERSIAQTVGCQPHWHNFRVETLPICNNVPVLTNYSDIEGTFAWKNTNELIEATKCLMPCSFTEYKVGIKYDSNNV